MGEEREGQNVFRTAGNTSAGSVRRNEGEQAAENRAYLDALEDDEVREALKLLHTPRKTQSAVVPARTDVVR